MLGLFVTIPSVALPARAMLSDCHDMLQDLDDDFGRSVRAIVVNTQIASERLAQEDRTE